MSLEEPDSLRLLSAFPDHVQPWFNRALLVVGACRAGPQLAPLVVVISKVRARPATSSGEATQGLVLKFRPGFCHPILTF